MFVCSIFLLLELFLSLWCYFSYIIFLSSSLFHARLRMSKWILHKQYILFTLNDITPVENKYFMVIDVRRQLWTYWQHIRWFNNAKHFFWKKKLVTLCPSFNLWLYWYWLWIFSQWPMVVIASYSWLITNVYFVIILFSESICVGCGDVIVPNTWLSLINWKLVDDNDDDIFVYVVFF